MLCVWKCFFKQYIEDPTKKRGKLDLFLGNRERQVTESMREHFKTTDHSSINFVLFFEKTELFHVKVLNWVKANFDGIREEVAKVVWSKLFMCKGASSKWATFKNLSSKSLCSC